MAKETTSIRLDDDERDLFERARAVSNEREQREESLAAWMRRVCKVEARKLLRKR